jgi:hypothetical protein
VTAPMSNMDARNEFVVVAGQNLPNHSTSLAGRGQFVQIGQTRPMRTKQEAYRLVGWLLAYVDTLPDDITEATLEMIQEQIDSQINPQR